MLLRGAARGSAAAGASSMPTDSNILRMAPVGPRFSYLPVTMPVALLRQSSMHQMQQAAGSGATPAAQLGLGAGGALAGSEVSASAYSFATLLSEGTGRGSRGAEGDASGGLAPAVGSGVGKLVGSLQGLIGDKAAEVTSALGDMSGSSLLSSFARFKQ